MKRKIMSVFLAFLLILSLSVVAYADSSPYSYTVTATNRYFLYEVISEQVMHIHGTPGDEVPCYFGGRVYGFNSSQFDSAYNVGLMDAYRDAGLKERLTVPVISRTMEIDPYQITGFFWAELAVYNASGTWNVKYENSIIRNGTFRDSPINYAPKLCFEPI